MVDRVPSGLGLVGRVDDAEVMAGNIMAVLGGDRRAIGERARAHALQFSWDQSMERLFGHVYRDALARAGARSGIAAIPPQPVLAEAA
jgi:alpha-1,6-mannosyltransferase